MIRRPATLLLACVLFLTSTAALGRTAVVPPSASELRSIVETLAAPEMERCLGTLDRALHEMRRLQSMIATLEGRGDPTDLERHLISKYRAQLTALEEAKWRS